MRTQMGLLAIIGVFGWAAAADAQTVASATAGMAFDGKYRFVSSTPVNSMYTSYNGQTGMCPHRKPGPLHIAGARVHYTAGTGYRFDGMVGPQGELTM